MSVRKYFEYKGQKYGYGTKVKIKTRWSNEWHQDIRDTEFRCDGQFFGISGSSLPSANPDDYIVEIVEPVYYVEQEPTQGKKSNIFTRTGSGSWNSDDDVFHGLLLYIAVMLGGIIFNDRWLIWILATIVFFSWKAKK